MNYPNRYCFDVEIFKNFFCCTFTKIDTKEVKTFIIWKHRDDKNAMLEFISKRLFLVSFNGISYDMPILRFIREYSGNDINADLFELSSRLVSDAHRDDEDIKYFRYWRDPEPFVHQDLMAMMNFLKTGVGLKQCSINLKWHRVQDLPLPYTHIVKLSDVDTIVNYNINDTLITLELYLDPRVTEARVLRENIVDEYGVRILSAAKSKMADIFFEKTYEDETGISKKEFKELRTPRPSIKLSDVILPNIKFKTEKFNQLLEELKKITVFAYEDYKFDKDISYKGNKFILGVGGLHTKEKPALYKATKDLEILSMDVSSFYPAIMCEYRIKPEHLQEEFIDILTRVKNERLEAKKAGDNIKAETYKIIVNATFGKLGFSKYWIYDPLAMIRVTVNGQLFLLMLIESMEENGIHCISGNTDGCELLVPVGMKDKAYELAKQWEKETRFELEFTNYTLLAKRDVNSYLAVSTKGKKKTKGAFVDTIELEKGYLHPIVPKAVNRYLLEGVSVEKTIYECEDIFDFCISKKSGKDFQMELKTFDGVEDLQKTNRFYVSNSGGGLQKRNKEDNGIIGIIAGRNITILNDYDPSKSFSEYDVNKIWYIKQARSLIEAIETVQLDMFGFSGEYGQRVNMLGEKITKKKKKRLAKEITIEEVKKANNSKLTYDTNSAYALVVDVDTTWSPKIKLYSLSKGSETTFKIKKDIYTNLPLKQGDVVYLETFEEKDRVRKVDGKWIPSGGKEWWITKYSLIDDIKDFKRKVYE